jgi:hypothetical protein
MTLHNVNLYFKLLFFSSSFVVIPDDVLCGQNMLYILCINNVELNKCNVIDMYV